METVVNLHYVGPRGTRQNEKELAKVPNFQGKKSISIRLVSPLADLITAAEETTVKTHENMRFLVEFLLVFHSHVDF